jgi:4-methylaminobutanoate oxidase (formaldehyde-forming)
VRNADGVSDEFLRTGRYEIVVASETFPAEIGLEPFLDPANARIRA